MPIENNKFLYQKFSPAIRKLSGFAALALGLVIAQQSLSVSHAEASVQHIDKIVHAFAYCALGLLTLPALPKVSPLIVLIGLAVFGGIIELAQGMMSLGRKADVLDAAANSFGLLLALAFWFLATKLFSASLSTVK